MREIVPNALQKLANACPKPLYLVGGSVRDHLAGRSSSMHDLDVCAALSAEEFAAIAKENGFSIHSVYRNTGTVNIRSGSTSYEYAAFRSDEYKRGTHVCVEGCFTDNILLDAKRRDFTVNAVYYDIRNGKFVDPLHGIEAIEEKRLSAVTDPKKVFSDDPLRLMRLARLTAQLGFTPDDECIAGAKACAPLIVNVAPERIFGELCSLLSAEEKCDEENAAYRGLQILNAIGVSSYIISLSGAFYKEGFSEQTLRAVSHADKRVRLAALLHELGEVRSKAILSRLKAPKKVIERIPALIKWKNHDENCDISERALRCFFAEQYPLLEELILLKHSLFSAHENAVATYPVCTRWQALIQKMKAEGAPFTLKELAVTGADLLSANIPAPQIGTVLKKLLLHAACYPDDNEKSRLLSYAATL